MISYMAEEKKQADMLLMLRCEGEKKAHTEQHQTSGSHIDYKNHTQSQRMISIFLSFWPSNKYAVFLLLFRCICMNAQILNYLICNGAIIYRDFFFSFLLTCLLILICARGYVSLASIYLFIYIFFSLLFS